MTVTSGSHIVKNGSILLVTLEESLTMSNKTIYSLSELYDVIEKLIETGDKHCLCTVFNAALD